MPYIKVNRRDAVIPTFDDDLPQNAGELNYVITEIILGYYEMHGGRYQQINDILGALEGAKLEFYRRVASPYEDTKAEENGDVYGNGDEYVPS